MKSMLLFVILVSMLVACATIEKSQKPSVISSDFVLDGKLIEAAKRVPGFGGMFLDADGNLNVYLIDDLKLLDVETIKATKAEIKATLEGVFTKEFLSRQIVPRSGQDDKMLSKQPREIILIQGKYDIIQLSKWRVGIDNVLEIPGVVFTDLDEKQNRLKIGIEPKASSKPIEEILKKYGIPTEAVFIEIVKPVKFLAKTLRSKFRSMPGGVQTESDTGWFSYGICTMGFNAIRSGVNGFVTCSHCTKTMGGSEGTDFHQPDDPWWTEGNKVGDEIADPAYFTGGNCPNGRRCRYSDSAFIDYTVSRGRNIARTTYWNNGSITVNSSRPRFTIVDETSSWVDGSELDKIGRTTGWTYGYVNGTCQNVNVSDTNITLLCQYRVNQIPTTSQSIAVSGDSGSPVFVWQGSTVVLSGILWGAPDDGSSFYFSPLNQIEQELGSLATYNFSTPSIPQSCPNGQKCCEPEPGGGCLICVPSNAYCP